MRKLLLLAGAWVALAVTYAQPGNRPMTFEEQAGWQRITSQTISGNGKWVACKMVPWQGDETVLLYNQKGEKILKLTPANQVQFSETDQYLLVTLTPSTATVDSLKLIKTKKEEMPVNQLLIYSLLSGNEEVIDSLKSYKLSPDTDWVAYERSTKSDSLLYLRSLDGKQQLTFPQVKEYQFAAKGKTFYFLTEEKGEEALRKLYTYDTQSGKQTLIHEGTGAFKQIQWNKQGDRLAFLYSQEPDSTKQQFELMYSFEQQPARTLVNTSENFPDHMQISSHGSLRFSENGERLFFGIAPPTRQKDTTILAENRANVQVWTWNEGVQYTQQENNRQADLKKSYSMIYDLRQNQIIPLATKGLPRISTTDEDNARFALGSGNQSYEIERMWRGRDRQDVWGIDLENGEKTLIQEATISPARLSPKGKYAWWYHVEDSSWYCYSMDKKETFRLTTPTSFAAWNELTDVPDYPGSYGLAGWTTDDQEILIYDRYDIWKFDPEGKRLPVNLTRNGKQQGISYRLLQLDPEEKSLDPKKNYLLTGFDQQTKGSSYYTLNLSGKDTPKLLMRGDYKLGNPVKAKKSEAVIYTKETYEVYPDLYLSDLSFKKSIRLTDGYKQQEGIRWGTAELISWISLDGKKLEGVVYKPANFDSSKQYPLLVNFYERNSETLHNYRIPEPHRSTIDYHFYNSHEYVIFNPDVIYETGYPGESCYNCVMPGISSLIQEGYIDEQAIGAQGHSWGGYQVAYLATRTNLFAAIESGAPVVNMVSAYGGIRWSTGLNRSFQYEHGQSRIGATIWETPLRYLENSPIFTMDKVNTPILIMHNDQDGHVPWYQGIEYFIALRRLQKPAWLLNYPGEVHWPGKMANRIDFQKRMFQFFEHYLHNQPMPEWMEKGIPATDREHTLGY